MLTSEQIMVILQRLKWEPLYENRELVLAHKRGIGYSEDPAIAAIEARLSVMLEAAQRMGR